MIRVSDQAWNGALRLTASLHCRRTTIGFLLLGFSYRESAPIGGALERRLNQRVRLRVFFLVLVLFGRLPEQIRADVVPKIATTIAR
jgi:hypothetical protein